MKHEKSAENIFFLHAFSGCDKTLSLLSREKVKFWSLVQENPNLKAIIAIFKNEDANPEDIADAGARFVVAFYGGDMQKENLEDLRYQRLVSSTKSKFSLASLPPTRNAAQYHAFRTFYRVQK